MWNKAPEGFIGCTSSYEEAKIVLFGAPFDSTTSYRPGARFGPPAIRQESFGIETFSPYLDRDLTDKKIFDGGDLELPFGDTEAALSMIEAAADKILSDQKLPVLLGGEHLVSLGAIRACAKRYDKLHIIHFDAHTDLRDSYLGVKLSHASIIRRSHEILGDGRIFQFGIRSGDREEFAWADQKHTMLHRFDFAGLEDTVRSLSTQHAPVYFTVDLDVLDSSVFPGTGTPEAGGVSFEALRQAMALVAEQCDIVGCDLVELAPGLDVSGASTAVAVKLLRELLLALS